MGSLGFLFTMHPKVQGSYKQMCRACIPQLQHLHHPLEGFPGSQQASPSDCHQTCLKMFFSYVWVRLSGTPNPLTSPLFLLGGENRCDRTTRPDCCSLIIVSGTFLSVSGPRGIWGTSLGSWHTLTVYASVGLYHVRDIVTFKSQLVNEGVNPKL